ncbi:MAG: Hpt domain-containing protein [Terracidiphilus sp.]
MKRLWTRFLPQLEERVAILHGAAAAVAEGTLSSEHRAQAISAAHKLAGVLGTFGLAEGTDLAREAETFYSSELETDSATSERLARIPLQLQAMFASRE